MLIPEAEIKQKVERYSVVYFAHPDYDTIIQPLDGSDAYPPITAKQYLQDKLTATYNKVQGQNLRGSENRS